MPEHDTAGARRRPQDSSATGVTGRLRWYVNRLRCMTPAEVQHRVLQALAMQGERWGLVGPAPAPPPDVTRASRPWVRAPAQANAARYLEAADRVVAGRLDVFALRDV